MIVVGPQHPTTPATTACFALGCRRELGNTSHPKQMAGAGSEKHKSRPAPGPSLMPGDAAPPWAPE
jgi:hypothetical protein